MATGPRVLKLDKSEQHGKKFEERAGDVAGLGGVMGSLRVIELQLVAFIVVFSASGLVPVLDLVFPIFITIYCFLLSYFVFPNYGNPDALQLFKGNRAFQFYVIIGTVIGLFLPLAYVLGGFARGDQEAVRAATPHLFLLSFQVLSENIIRGLNIFSLPVRALLPILYNMRRLFTLVNWVAETFFSNKLSPDIPYQVSNYTLSLPQASAISKFKPSHHLSDFECMYLLIACDLKLIDRELFFRVFFCETVCSLIPQFLLS